MDALRLPVHPWHPGPKPRYVRIEPDTVTGICFPGTEPTRDTPPDEPDPTITSNCPDKPR